MINALLIGAGAVVEGLYCSALRRLEKAGAVRVAGVVDTNEPRARQIADGFRNSLAFVSCDDAFGASSYDLAIVASPPGMHADHACVALEQGCHVLCEKPMSVTSADARRMTAVAESAGRTLGVALTRRFFSNFADVAALVAEGHLGDDLRFTYREGDTYGWPVATGAAFQRVSAGGGALMDKGVHMLDQLSWIFGEPTVAEAFDDSLAGGVETNSVVGLKFPNARGTLQVSWEYPLNNGLRIWGSSGEVALDGIDIRTYRRRQGSTWARIPARTDWPADMAPTGGKRVRPGNYFVCMELQLVAMLRCIAYGEAFPVTGAEATRVQATIDEAYAVAQPLPSPWLPDDEQRAARAMHWKAAESR
jgi:predicted dehydrogenase